MNEPTQPPSCFACGCPLAGVARGFVLGAGDPQTARYAIALEAPGREEVSFELRPNPNRGFLRTREECERELGIRRRDYPGLDERWLRMGVPVVGATGLALQSWIWPKVGIRREECYIDNTIRCLVPKGKDGQAYPIGAVRKEAERCCRQYDRVGAFWPDTMVFTIHPASPLREITPLPLVIKDFEKVRDFTAQGRKVLALLGGKATAAFARYGSNIARWRGHYAPLAPDWSETYKTLFAHHAKKRAKAMSDDPFAVPEVTLEKARKKKERPAELLPGACKSAKRHTHRRPPKCGYADCWAEFERRQAEPVGV